MRNICDLFRKSLNSTNCTFNDIGLYPLWAMVVFWGLIVDPAVAKLAPWLKFEPNASRYALRYGNPKLSAETKSSSLHKLIFGSVSRKKNSRLEIGSWSVTRTRWSRSHHAIIIDSLGPIMHLYHMAGRNFKIWTFPEVQKFQNFCYFT